MAAHSSGKEEKIRNFDPDGPGNTEAGIFGLPFTIQESDVVIIPVPWEVTVSNFEGTSQGPANILDASRQIDLFDDLQRGLDNLTNAQTKHPPAQWEQKQNLSDPWKAGIAMEEIPGDVLQKNNQLRPLALEYIMGRESRSRYKKISHPETIKNKINEACQQLTSDIQEKCAAYLQQNKLPVILGGDHSTPLGLMRALTRQFNNFGVLQIDAHADLRPAYEGFTYSHASIMYNAMAIEQISKFVQVGLRDICSGEYELIRNNPKRMTPYFAREIHNRGFAGECWQSICREIVNQLPELVYISFDIDGLDPAYCPSTGTPVPGGLSYNGVLYLLEELVRSGRKIIAFDLVETGPQTLDAIVACRLLYKISALMLHSNHKI